VRDCAERLLSALRRPSEAILATRRVSITIGFTAAVKDRTEDEAADWLRSWRLRASRIFLWWRSIFLWRSTSFFTPQKNQKNRPMRAFAAHAAA
jgi:hypothetical protein